MGVCAEREGGEIGCVVECVDLCSRGFGVMESWLHWFEGRSRPLFFLVARTFIASLIADVF